MTEVEARRPGTKGELLRLGGLQWLWWGMDDDRGRGAAAKEQGRTPAARRPAVVVVGYGRRPRSRRGGQGPRANSCGSAACSGCGGVWTTTEVEARRPRTNGQLLRLGGLQCVGGGTANDRGRGAVARDQGPTSVAQGPAVGGLGDAGCPWSRRCGQRPRGNSCSSEASKGEVQVSGS